jgi:TrmH family RNA methyltransferase
MKLTSVNNDKVKLWQKLKDKKYRDIYKLFLVEGDHLVNEALKHNIVKEIITTDTNSKYDVDTYYVNDKIMKILSNQVTFPNVIGVCSLLEGKDIDGNILVLDNIQDPGNLGTIIRSASAFNFKNIILSNDTVDVYNPKVIRATEGMIFNINVIRTDIIDFLNNLDKKYIKITTDVNNGEDIRNIDSNNIVLVIGNEGNGVRKEVSDICDKKVYIKMNSNTESLNAAVAGSILMYEVNHE